MNFQDHSSISQEMVRSMASLQPQEEIKSSVQQSVQAPISDSESYLSISFHEILSLIFRNESPQLLNALQTSVNRSLIILRIMAIFIIAQLIVELVSLYMTLASANHLKEVSGMFYCFKILSDAVFMYSIQSLLYVVLEAAQINNGDISVTVIEYLKYTSRVNSPLEGFDDEMLSQAQQVANIIAAKVSTTNWMNFLINHLNGHVFSINRVIFLSQILLFVWGNIMLIQDRSQGISIILIGTVFSLSIGYLIILGLLMTVVIVCMGIPILILVVLWQSCNWFSGIYYEIREYYTERQRQQFITSLHPEPFSAYKLRGESREDCAICLENHNDDQLCIKLPCPGGHLFHDECIQLWIQEHGSCPLCRTRFVPSRIDY